jgi:two-component system CheB/CheR fusion protein
MASTIASSRRVWPLHGGETGALIRTRDWSATPLGDAAQWPERFRAAVDTCLDAAVACFVWWGPELVQIYNDAALPIVQARHPAVFGVPARDAWPDVWPAVAPIVARVMRTGRPVRRASMSLPQPDAEAASIGFRCSPLRDAVGAVAGVLVTAFDTTRTAWPRPYGPALPEAMAADPGAAFGITCGARREDVLQRDNLANWPDLVMRETGETLRWVPGASFPLAKSDDCDDAHSIVPDSAGAGSSVDDCGDVSRSRGVTRDTADETQAAERMAIMIAELQHRTRNLIAVVRAIISRTLATSPAPDAFWRRIDDRLRALSRVQGLLSRAGQEPITIGALVRLEFDEGRFDQGDLDPGDLDPGDLNQGSLDQGDLARRGARRERVDIAGPAVRLRYSFVQTLALALHELAANARAYGALSAGGGRLRIGWWLEQRGRRSWLVLNWVEKTRRQAAPPVRKGYGRTFIEHALSYSHGAETHYELDETGLWCSIALPLGPDGNEEHRP